MEIKFKEGLKKFFIIEMVLAAVTLIIGTFLPPIKIPASWLVGLPSVAAINLVGWLLSLAENAVRFLVWLVYARLFRLLVVNNSMDFAKKTLTAQVLDNDANDSPAWLIFAGYVGLAIILGLKVSFATLGSFLLYAPLRVLWGSLLALGMSWLLVRSEASIKRVEDFCSHIGLSGTNGVAILVVTGCLIGALFA